MAARRERRRRFGAGRGGSLTAPAVVLALILAACGGDDSPRPSSASGAKAPRDTLTVAMIWDSDVAMQSHRTGANMCEPLVRLGTDFQPQPQLATKWEYRGENTFRFTLRQGVTFHDGTPFNADAVKYTFSRMVELRLYAAAALGPDSVKVIDAYTIDVTPIRPNQRLVEQLTHPATSIVAPGTEPANKPVCTGPFRFVEYQPNQRLVVNRYDGYWGEKAKIRQITYRLIPDANTRALALRSGDVDMVKDLPRQQIGDVEKTPGLAVVKSPVGSALIAELNTSKPNAILADLDVRRALSMAIDRPTIVNQTLVGEVKLQATMSPPELLSRHASIVQGAKFDLAQAEALLDQKGWRKGSDGIREKEGRKLSLVLSATPDLDPGAMQLVQIQLRRAGFDMKLELAPDAAAVAARRAEGNFDVLFGNTNQGDATPTQLVSSWAYTPTQSSNNGKWSQPGARYDQLVGEALAAVDLDVARQKSAEAQRLLLEEHVSMLVLAGSYRVWGVKADIGDFSPHGNWLHQHWESVT